MTASVCQRIVSGCIVDNNYFGRDEELFGGLLDTLQAIANVIRVVI